jgi:prepilin-type N-terminal cleavage/methylation domain-containing protein
MRTRRRTQGFTLPELMAVVAIICVVGALAARMYSAGVRGETAPAFARSVLGAMADARHMAVALGKRTRITLNTSPMRLDTESQEPTTGGWVAQGSLKLPSTLQLCVPRAAAEIGTIATPTCPLTSTSLNRICFSTSGKVSMPNDGDCTKAASNPMTGATIYFETMNADHKYRIVVWGLTGMAKVIDQW